MWVGIVAIVARHVVERGHPEVALAAHVLGPNVDAADLDHESILAALYTRPPDLENLGRCTGAPKSL
jgi:hypothetical protein